jgi:hypothetical protein
MWTIEELFTNSEISSNDIEMFLEQNKNSLRIKLFLNSFW